MAKSREQAVKQCESCEHFNAKVYGNDGPISGKCFGWLPEVRYVQAVDTCERWKEDSEVEA